MDKDEFAARIGQIKSKLYRTALLHTGNETMALDAVDEAVCRQGETL